MNLFILNHLQYIYTLSEDEDEIKETISNIIGMMKIRKIDEQKVVFGKFTKSILEK